MARPPVPIHHTLVVAFAAVVALLVTVGGTGVQALGQANDRTVRLASLQGKVSIYRQLRNNTTVKLYAGVSALFNPDPAALETVLRQPQQSYDFRRVQFAARDERELLTRIEGTYNQFVAVMAEGIERVRQLPQGQELQRTRAKPLADRLERLTNQLVNRAESDIASLVDMGLGTGRCSGLATVRRGHRRRDPRLTAGVGQGRGSGEERASCGSPP